MVEGIFSTEHKKEYFKIKMEHLGWYYFISLHLVTLEEFLNRPYLLNVISLMF